jgi:very-short-patch-repair endonuclease
VGEERLAVEVDGPQHFCSNVPSHPLGGTVLRDRILRQAGWRVLSVPLHAWRAMQGRRAAAMQRDFMRRHIAAALA